MFWHRQKLPLMFFNYLFAWWFCRVLTAAFLKVCTAIRRRHRCLPSNCKQISRNTGGGYVLSVTKFAYFQTQNLVLFTCTVSCIQCLCDCCKSTVFLQVVKDSFAQAAAEPKLTSREQLVQRNAAALAAGSKAADVREGLSGSGGSSNTIQRERHAQYSRYFNRQQN